MLSCKTHIQNVPVTFFFFYITQPLFSFNILCYRSNEYFFNGIALCVSSALHTVLR